MVNYIISSTVTKQSDQENVQTYEEWSGV